MEFKNFAEALAKELDAAIEFETFEEGEVEAVLTLKLESNRHQEVRLESTVDEGESILRVTTEIGPVSKFAPEKFKELLILNGSLNHGAFALIDGKIVLTDAATSQQISDLRRKCRHMARKADQMEKMFLGVDRT